MCTSNFKNLKYLKYLLTVIKQFYPNRWELQFIILNILMLLSNFLEKAQAAENVRKLSDFGILMTWMENVGCSNWGNFLDTGSVTCFVIVYSWFSA